jgi:hypothetical protein
MMHKLITLGTITLIGLSSIMLTGCPGNPLSIDELDESYEVYYDNQSSEVIVIQESSRLIQLEIEAGFRKEYSFFVGDSDGGQPPIQKYVDLIGDKVTITVEGSIKKEWEKPAGSFGNNVNSPFNYDSWMLELLEPDANNVVGKITFTITDDDLN